jgi:hypothetical protein
MKAKKVPKSRYCLYHGSCDKEYNCRDEEFCSAFKHTDLFSSLDYSGKGLIIDHSDRKGLYKCRKIRKNCGASK